MFKVEVISLIGCDVNEESTMIRNGQFYDGTFNPKSKRIEITVPADTKYSDALPIFMSGVTAARAHRFHNYQSVIDKHLARDDVDDRSRQAIASINQYDLDFHASAHDHLVQFATSKLDRRADNRGYHFNGRSDMTRRIRSDIIDEDLPVLMTHREYSLTRLYRVLQEHDVVQHIRGLSDAGLISDADMDTINQLGREMPFPAAN
jgi:hypothetical protein